MTAITYGIYDALTDEFLRDTLVRPPELPTVFVKIDPEAHPARYAFFVAKILELVLNENPT